MNNFWNGFEKQAGLLRTLGNVTGARHLKAGLKQVKREVDRGTPTQQVSMTKMLVPNSRRKRFLKANDNLNTGAKRMAGTALVAGGAAYGANKVMSKQAYDYAHEVKEYQEYAKERQNDEPIGVLPAIGTGAALGAGVGGIAAAHMRGPLLKASLLGAALGGLFGFGASKLSEGDIDESKRIMGMPKKDRDSYLRSLARKDENVYRYGN